MTWYQHINYGGVTTVIYGSAGTCDYTGYSVVPDYYWQFHMSAIRGWGDCNYARVVNKQNLSTWYCLPTPGIGNADNYVNRIQIMRETSRC